MECDPEELLQKKGSLKYTFGLKPPILFSYVHILYKISYF